MTDNATYTRSCTNCYQRKLGCDKVHPCSRCVARGQPDQCTFPDKRITRNRPKKADSAVASPQELEAKIARLEKELIGLKEAHSSSVTLYSLDPDDSRALQTSLNSEHLHVLDSHGGRRNLHKIGRARIDSEELKDVSSQPTLKNLKVEQDDEDEEAKLPFILPVFASMAGGPLSSADIYTPNLDELEAFWGLYCWHVDTIIRLVHKPTIRRLIDRVKLLGLESCTASEQALLTSIMFCATYCLAKDDERIETMFHETYSGLRSKVTHAVEVAMSRLNLATTRDFVALQAFTIYISTKIFDENTAEMWATLWCPVALAVRVAYGLYLHVDGSILGLSPYETEMHRRIWWMLVVLAIRTSEVFTCDLIPASADRQVQLPTNISDDDMDPDSLVPYVDTVGPTEMTANVLRAEAVAAVAQATREEGSAILGASFAEKTRQFEIMIHNKYIVPAEAQSDNIFSRLVITLAKSVTLKLCWVWGYSVMMRSGTPPKFGPIKSYLSDELFTIATKMLDHQLVLQESVVDATLLVRFKWMMRNIKPWDGVTVLLAQLRTRLQTVYSSQTRFEQLPPMMQDAWNVSCRALNLREHWQINKKVLNGLLAMQEQLGEIMRVPKHTYAQQIITDLGPANQSLWQSSDALETLTEDLSMDDYMPSTDASGLNDPWPMFIPTNFNFFAGTAF